MKTIKLQFEIPEDRIHVLDTMMEEAGMGTRTDLFNNSVALFGWAIRQRKDGRAIASMDYEKGSVRELEMPVFDAVGLVVRPARAGEPSATGD